MILLGKHINKFYKKYALFLIIGIIFLIFVDWIQLYIPEFLGKIVDILDHNGDADEIYKISFYVVLVGIGMFLGRTIWRLTIFHASKSIEDDLRHEMFLKAEQLSRNFYHNNKIGSIMDRFTNDLENIEEFFGWGTIMIIDAVFLSILVIIKMVRLDFVLCIFTLIPIFLIVIWGAMVEKFMSNKWNERQNAFDKLYDFTRENFTGIKVIKAFVKENKELHAFAKIARNNKEINIKFVRISVVFDILIEIIIALIFSLLLGFGGYFAWCAANSIKPFGLETTLTASKLVTFLGYFDTLIWPMIALGQIVTMKARSKAALKRISAFLDAEVDVKSPDNAIVLKNVKGNISFKNFSFNYGRANYPVLKNINLDIKAGESIGIIGKIGCGKTTLINVLLYLYNVNPNSVFIDGYDISKCDIDSVRNFISYVPQDNFLFSDSVENNILFGIDGDQNDAIEAAKFSSVHDDITRFSKGYLTEVGERGVTLSGGQKQRISISRAYVKKSPILILDDSVSAVDTKTEEEILHNIVKNRKNQTTIVIASRVSTVCKLDKVIVMNDGEIEAFDTPKNLENISETYKKMVYLQKLESEVEGRNESNGN